MRYILENPVRAELVSRVEQYPFLGSSVYTIPEILEAVQLNAGWEPGPAYCFQDSLNALVSGYRRSRPKLLRVILTPGGAWRRLYSAV